MTKQKANFLYLFNFLFFLLFDRLTKSWALANIKDQAMSIFPGFNLSLSWNRGVSWGMFNKSSSFGFILLSIIIALVIIFFTAYTIFLYKKGKSIFLETLVLSGAISNFIDRIYYGAVVDFIDFYAGSWHWPTFNIADACIVIGIVGIIIRGFYESD